MVTLKPVERALVPIDSPAAQQISALNYDEFQSDDEIREILAENPRSLLRVTMPHCTVPPTEAPAEGSDAALAIAAEEMGALLASNNVRQVEHLLWVYEIISPKRPDRPQLGVGGNAATAEIRTPEHPSGSIIRNEGIRPDKAEGRARLIEAIRADTGFVNLAVPDDSGKLLKHLQRVVAARGCDYEALDEASNRHRVWLVTAPNEQQQLMELVGEQPAAYVADGNHRSAAAAALRKESFLSVFFAASRMGLEPYNRLLPLGEVGTEEFLARLADNFIVEKRISSGPFRPRAVHTIGVYCDGTWYQLTPKPGSFDPRDAAQSIDADIVQRHIIAGALGISDARDKRINYVGGNKNAAYLQARVDAGDYDVAVSLAPVTMEQFIAVCEQNKFMPPKSTWFDPKIRTGLVISLLDG